jgi:hypothetical protein
MSNLPT